MVGYPAPVLQNALCADSGCQATLLCTSKRIESQASALPPPGATVLGDSVKSSPGDSVWSLLGPAGSCRGRVFLRPGRSSGGHRGGRNCPDSLCCALWEGASDSVCNCMGLHATQGTLSGTAQHAHLPAPFLPLGFFADTLRAT